MGDDPNQGKWPSRLTPHSSRAAITQGAREIAVDDFIDSHLRERPKTVHPEPDPVTARRPEVPPAPAPPNAWAPAAPPRPGTNRTLPIPPADRPAVRTVPMQAVAMPPRGMPPPGPPLPDDDDGGGRTMLLTPEQAAAAAAAQASALAGTLASSQGSPAKRSAPPATGLAGTMLMPMITGPSPSAPPPAPPAPPAPAGATPHAGPLPGYVEPARPQGPSPHYIEPARPQGPAPTAMAPFEAIPESTYVPPKRGGGLLWIGVLVGVVLAGGAAFAYSRGYLAALTGGGVAARSPETAEPTASPATPPPARAPAASQTATAVPAPGPSPSASTASPSAAPPVDAKPLLSFEGALTVSSKTDAEVVLQGASVGRTNQRLVVRCGPKNVRLRTGITWLSPGQPVQITCMQENAVTIEATTP